MIMTKTITIVAIISAFILGSVGSLTMAEANPASDQVAAAIDSLTSAVLNISSVAGPQGEQGIQGEQGPAGGFLTTYVNNGPSTNVPANNFATSTANCDAGDIATGGGSTLGTVAKLVSSLPTFTGITPTGWAVQAFNPTTQLSVFIAAVVICVDVTP